MVSMPGVYIIVIAGLDIKHWPRVWKTDLVEKHNPEWRDLFDEMAR
jgi:predicted GIY-YIG superfamily endonuclease